MINSFFSTQTKNRPFVFFIILMLSSVILGSTLYPFLFVSVNESGLQGISRLSILNQATKINLNSSAIINDCLFKFPIIYRIFVFFEAIIPIFAITFMIFRKYVHSATFFFINFMIKILILFSIQPLKCFILDNYVSSNRLSIQVCWFHVLGIFLTLVNFILVLKLKNYETIFKAVLFCLTCFAVGIIFLVGIFVAIIGIPAITEIGGFKFLFGTCWKPEVGKYGSLNLTLSSIITTTLAILIGAPFGIFTAVHLTQFTSKKFLKFIKPLIELLCGIPSVVYGFFGMMVLVPTIKSVFNGSFNADGSPVTGDSLLAATLVLSIMTLPTILNMSLTAIGSVPNNLKSASLGLGATQIQTIFKVVLPAAKTGIYAGIFLGVGRAIGETMAILMVAGNVAKAPNLLGSVRVLTTGIAIDLAYSSGLFKKSLFALGLLLFIILTAINLIYMQLSKKEL